MVNRGIRRTDENFLNDFVPMTVGKSAWANTLKLLLKVACLPELVLQFPSRSAVSHEAFVLR